MHREGITVERGQNDPLSVTIGTRLEGLDHS
jgi:hypothetical protein